MDPYLAFISPILHNFLTLIYEWDSITLMPNINCSRFLPFSPSTVCYSTSLLIHKREIRSRVVTLMLEVVTLGRAAEGDEMH